MTFFDNIVDGISDYKIYGNRRDKRVFLVVAVVVVVVWSRGEHQLDRMLVVAFVAFAATYTVAQDKR